MKLLAPNLYKVILTNKAMRTSSRNLYIIKGNGRSLMIDTSWKVPECLNEMEHVLKELSIDYRDLDIFVTHNHADHSGYISLFIERGARAFMNPWRSPNVPTATIVFMRQHHAPLLHQRMRSHKKNWLPMPGRKSTPEHDQLARETIFLFIFPLPPLRRGTRSPAAAMISRSSPYTVIQPVSVARGEEEKAFLLR